MGGKLPCEIARDDGTLAAMGVTFLKPGEWEAEQKAKKLAAAKPKAMAGNNKIRIVETPKPAAEPPKALKAKKATTKNGKGASGFKDKIAFEKSALKTGRG